MSQHLDDCEHGVSYRQDCAECEKIFAPENEASLTLWLARHGHSPEDTRRGVERALARTDAALAELVAVNKAMGGGA